MLRLASWAIRKPRRALLVVAAGTVLCAAALPRLELCTDGATLHPRSGAAVLHTRADRARFRDPETVILLVRARDLSLRSAAGLRALAALHDSLAALHDPVAGVSSLASLLDARSASLGGGFLDHVPDDPAPLLERLDAEPLARGLFLDAAGRRAAFYVSLDAETPRRVALARLEAWIEARAPRELEIALLGPAVAEARLGDAVLRDLLRLVPIAIAVIAAALFLALRRIVGVLVPLATGVCVLVCTFGLMALAGVPVTLVTTILPVLLLALSITDSMHVLEHLDRGLVEAGAAAPMGDGIGAALHDVHRPVVATSVTTAAGFLAFAVAPLAPLRQFGAFAGLGILLALVSTFVLMPALVLVLPPAWLRRRSLQQEKAPNPRSFVIRHWRLGFVAGLAAAALAVPGLARLQVQDAWVDNFAAGAPIVRAERDYNSTFWGSYRYDLVLEAEPGFFLRPEGAALAERVAARARSAPFVGGVEVYTATLAGIARAIGAPVAPETRSAAQLASLAALASMSPERSGLLQLLTPAADAARLRLHVQGADFARARAVDDFVRTELVPLCGDLRWHASGDLPLGLAVVGAIVANQLRSLAFAVAGIALLVFVIVRCVRTTVAALVPVCMTAVLVLGGMAYAGLPLGIATSMFASVALGVGVDFALHLLHGYRCRRRDGQAWDAALASTLGRAGRAIRWNALVLAAGFAVLGFSEMRPDRALGILLAVAMLAGHLTTVLCLPGVVRLLRLAVAAACFALPGAVRAAEPARHDPPAAALVRETEMRFRRLPRLVRMEISSRFTGYQNTERTLFGALDGDTTTTHLLYVFTRPEVLRGMSLLIRDPADVAAADSIWLYMPAFERLRLLDPQNQKMLVPGTALTHEDARGFVPVDKYTFAFAAEDRGDGAERLIVARPRSARIASQVGYVSMALRLDPRRHLVRRIDFAGPGGKPHKIYELLDEVDCAGTWLPQRARVTHLDLGFDSTIEFRYWPLAAPLPPTLFAPEIDSPPLLDRLVEVLARHGIRDSTSAPGR